MNNHPVNAHEESDANIRVVVRFGLGLAVLLVVAAIAMLLLFKYLQARPAPETSALAEEREIPPSPRLQVTPSADLESMRASEENLLDSYGWVDRNAGVVRIPIDRAMELLLQRGYPARPQPPAANQEAKP